ncbi:MAG: excisionase [Bullifex sp.]|nr:excisionase [Bullifex sp.]MDY4799996.1 excisionase [Bullifex sp.]
MEKTINQNQPEGCIRPNAEVPIWEKSNLTLEEAAAYSGIGRNKLRELTNERNCRFVLWNGNKRLIKRRELDKFTSESFSI